MTENQHVTLDLAHPSDDPVGPITQAGQGLSPLHAIAPQRPPRTLGRNLGRRASLIRPVVPFRQIRLHNSLFSKPGQLAGAPCSYQRAHQDRPELPRLQVSTQVQGLRLAFWQQRHVGPAGMAPIPAPCRLAVTDHHQLPQRADRTRPATAAGHSAGTLVQSISAMVNGSFHDAQRSIYRHRSATRAATAIIRTSWR